VVNVALLPQLVEEVLSVLHAGIGSVIADLAVRRYSNVATYEIGVVRVVHKLKNGEGVAGVLEGTQVVRQGQIEVSDNLLAREADLGDRAILIQITYFMRGVMNKTRPVFVWAWVVRMRYNAWIAICGCRTINSEHGEGQLLRIKQEVHWCILRTDSQLNVGDSLLMLQVSVKVLSFSRCRVGWIRWWLILAVDLVAECDG